MPPTVQVVGVYSPSANATEYEAFLSAEVSARNPINFSEETKALFVRFGRAGELVELHPEELAEIRVELERDFGSAALVEVLVTDPDSTFSIAAFVQPNPEGPRGHGQVAWCEKYITADLPPFAVPVFEKQSVSQD